MGGGMGVVLLNNCTQRLVPPFFTSKNKKTNKKGLLSFHFKTLNPKLYCYDDDDDPVIGDCLVFEQDAFDDSVQLHQQDQQLEEANARAENLVPDDWRELQAELHLTKKERRKIAQEIESNKKKKKGSLKLEEYQAYRDAKLSQLKPLLLHTPSSFKPNPKSPPPPHQPQLNERVNPKNPRWAVYGKGFDHVTAFFNTQTYAPPHHHSHSQRPPKLFSKEEKLLLNKPTPHHHLLTSSKWKPLHTLAASGEFYLVDALLKHNVDINAVDADGLTALHKAIICKKQAITSYLLRQSANPFVQDSDGGSLMHYAVRTASAPAIKLLLLYNVDINVQDNDGWTPLHVAVHGRRTDIVKLLLIRGADKTLRNKDGLTPLELCLYSGRTTRTYELIKILKQLPKVSTAVGLRKNPYNLPAS